MHLQRLVKHGDVRADRPRHYKATGPDSPEWQGSDIGYGQAHTRVRKARGKASQAVCTCGRAATDWAYDGLDENEKTSPEGLVYSADPDRYVAMCRSCHLKQDGVAPTVEAKKLGLETRWGK